jgi:putative phosphoribosyl transferase
MERAITIPVDGVTLSGDLVRPSGAVGLVIFAHGSGSSRKSPRNRMVAASLHAEGFATLLFDLLTVDEEAMDQATAQVARLARRWFSRYLAEPRAASSEPWQSGSNLRVLEPSRA